MSYRNPVQQYYPDYIFPSLPVLEFSSYSDVLDAAKNVSKSCILVNTNQTTLNNTQLKVDLNFDDNITVFLVMNIVLTGRSYMVVEGSNFNITNIDFFGGDSTYDFPTYLIRVNGEKISVINFSFVKFEVGNDDKDYFRNTCSGQGKNKVINTLFDGKKSNGIFLRSDNSWGLEVFQCVFKDHDKGGDSNGGEAIRIGVGSKQDDNTNVLISDCYFENCVSDPEVISIKTSSNTLKRIVMVDCKGKRLVFRNGDGTTLTESFFSDSGLRIYGADHVFENIQLVKGSEILLDKKDGYQLPEDCTLNNIYYQDTSTPIRDEGENNKITNVVEELKFTAEDLLNGNDGPTGPPIQNDFRMYTESGRTVENKEIYIDENFTIEYIPSILQTYNMIVTNVETGEVIHQQQENSSPYFLYGDISGIPLYGFINNVGTYDLKIKQTGEVFTFNVINPLSPTGPPVDNHKFKLYVEEGREIDMNNPEILVDEGFSVEYLTSNFQTYNFELIENATVEVIHSQRERSEPYFLFGNRGSTIYYNSVDLPGTYVVKIQQTGDELIFKVREEVPETYDVTVKELSQEQVDLIKEQIDQFTGQDSYNLVLKQLITEQLIDLQNQINNILG